MTNEHGMTRAIELARHGWYTSAPNPRVGCVLMRDDVVLGEGWHVRAGEPHAEVRALADARARGHDTRGATVCVTLEPCSHHGRTPPCVDALVEAGVGRVVVGARDPNPKVDGRGIGRLRAAGIEVVTDVHTQACEALNPGFNQRMRTGYPRVRVKLAMSLDGRTAAANGDSQWITGVAARDDVHRLRAESGAVMIGSGTLLADDPSLTVRLAGDWPQPRRVVLDSRLRMPPDARMLGLPGATHVFTSQAEQAPTGRALSAAGAHVHSVDMVDGRLDVHQVLAELGRQEINDVLVEAGPTLAGALAAKGLVDAFVIYMAPQLLGDGGRGLLTLPGVRTLDGRVELTIDDIQAVGQDWRIQARPA